VDQHTGVARSISALEDADEDSCAWRSRAFALGSLLAQTQAQQRGADRLVGLVVHELKTPVAVIKAYAELLEAQSEQHATAIRPRELMAHILEQADLMADWVKAMLEVQHLQSGELRLARSRVDLVQLAWTVAEELQQTTRLHHIRVVTANPPPTSILVDRLRVRQVLANLLENAIKYAAGGTIQVRVGVQDAHAIVSVHDEGRGLDRTELERIFAPFEQSTRRGVGLGLGLYLGRQIARVHGGDLWAESHGRGNGSTFILRLPMQQ
jgi:signal transduction histidine kinase